MSSGSYKALGLSLAANIGIAIAKFTVFGITRSSAMLTEAIHSSADCGNQVLLFAGMKRAEKPATPRFPLGQGQAAFVASFLVALLLFSVGGLYSGLEGWQKIRHPETPHHLAWAVGLLLLAFVMESISLRGALQAAKSERGNRTLMRYMRQSSATELVVVLAEDMAALVGLAIAFCAVLITLATGNPVWDGIGSLLIGLLLIAVAGFVGVEVASLLMNEAPPLALRAAIRDAVDEDPSVHATLNLIAVAVGSERLMVALKIRFKDQPSGQALVAAINGLEVRLKKRFPQIQHLFVEPDSE